jgi:predicted Zn-dependent peptidase
MGALYPSRICIGMDQSQVRLQTLDNGIRVVTERVPHLNSVSLGLTIDAGSRDEPEELAGVSHFLEHMLFKGTKRRTARDIAEEMDAVGGQMDAFTTKEYTGYGARVLPEHVPLALDVLADMLRHSLLDPAEIELEKQVILEEYKSVEDSPEEYVIDVFNELLWPDHPLGRPILGRPKTIKKLRRDDLLRYLETRYTPDRYIVAAVGNLEHEALIAELERHFGDMAGGAPEREPRELNGHREHRLVRRKTEQAHFCLGFPGVSETDPDRWTVRVLALVLGGGMSSRLFQEIREKRGLCYSIGAETVTYREGGMFAVYADTSARQMGEVVDLALQELRGAARKGITAAELERARNQVRASTLLSMDDVVSRMHRLSRGLLYQGRVLPIEELLGYVDAVTVEDCRRVGERLFGDERYALAAIGPFAAPKGR